MVSSGFFNSIGGDRKYTNEQFSSIISTLVTDGVFQHVGEKFYTAPVSGMDVGVKPGFAWFDNAWIKNDSLFTITVPASDLSLFRYDAIVIEMNSTEGVREGTIKLIQGAVASAPVKPGLINTEYVHQHAIAYIKVNPAVTTIETKDIEIVVGLEACPFVTGILATTDISEMFNQWDGEFNTWFNNLKLQLTDDVVTNLQGQINSLGGRVGQLETQITAKANQSDLNALSTQVASKASQSDLNAFKEQAAVVLSGTGIPAWNLGKNGDIYIKIR